MLVNGCLLSTGSSTGEHASLQDQTKALCMPEVVLLWNQLCHHCNYLEQVVFFIDFNVFPSHFTHLLVAIGWSIWWFPNIHTHNSSKCLSHFVRHQCQSSHGGTKKGIGSAVVCHQSKANIVAPQNFFVLTCSKEN